VHALPVEDPTKEGQNRKDNENGLDQSLHVIARCTHRFFQQIIAKLFVFGARIIGCTRSWLRSRKQLGLVSRRLTFIGQRSFFESHVGGTLERTQFSKGSLSRWTLLQTCFGIERIGLKACRFVTRHGLRLDHRSQRSNADVHLVRSPGIQSCHNTKVCTCKVKSTDRPCRVNCAACIVRQVLIERTPCCNVPSKAGLLHCSNFAFD
jgi:hypothetical protein